MAKRKEENFCSPENAKRPRLEEMEDFDRDGDDERTVSFTNGTSTLVSTGLQNCFLIGIFLMSGFYVIVLIIQYQEKQYDF